MPWGWELHGAKGVGGVVHDEAITHTCACGHVIAISMVADTKYIKGTMI